MGDPLLDALARDHEDPIDIVATVTSVNDNGTVNISVRGTVVPAVALANYMQRAINDQVIVRVRPGQYLVVGRVGPPITIPAQIELTRSDSAAPAGYEQIAGLWAKDGALWMQRTAPVPPPAPLSPATLPRGATDCDTYRGGGRLFRGRAEQGDYSGAGAQTGVWTFGAGAWGPLSGKTVTGIRITLTRTGAGGGSYGGLPVYLYLHNISSLTDSTPGFSGGPEIPGTLQANQSSTFTLPVTWAASLRDGTSAGIAVYAGTSRAENMELYPSATVYVDYLT